ncbi:hypothetical protein TraAM80_04306 [Trypanosoma rangeli]|uniref:Uncharacterized protein n=1 Tax=Trypanosoma rangeli TaxID=5698 RepID=A0A422NKI8_TRYRA|nr:uncharacterized protein TraAM80_04306 [Trypanosoma rangeli]RNF05839.1 hypothetical protein TraAM80_04306 [Trypanosoma rangeli]|eukprot:RNF05839.1 hypothetical protein TraAM80_04306 [Trypanosoma rangeli]
MREGCCGDGAPFCDKEREFSMDGEEIEGARRKAADAHTTAACLRTKLKIRAYPFFVFCFYMNCFGTHDMAVPQMDGNKPHMQARHLQREKQDETNEEPTIYKFAHGS